VGATLLPAHLAYYMLAATAPITPIPHMSWQIVRFRKLALIVSLLSREVET
jgi:hypothetical protein